MGTLAVVVVNAGAGAVGATGVSAEAGAGVVGALEVDGAPAAAALGYWNVRLTGLRQTTRATHFGNHADYEPLLLDAV